MSAGPAAYCASSANGDTPRLLLAGKEDALALSCQPGPDAGANEGSTAASSKSDRDMGHSSGMPDAVGSIAGRPETDVHVPHAYASGLCLGNFEIFLDQARTSEPLWAWDPMVVEDGLSQGPSSSTMAQPSGDDPMEEEAQLLLPGSGLLDCASTAHDNLEDPIFKWITFSDSRAQDRPLEHLQRGT
jgi:hypothetical protein